ncbi:MAG TPA: hypothetical protein VMH85_17300 [Terriglobales bacterium]|nr:hypothetical protein [Terriglobales bacterium]
MIVTTAPTPPEVGERLVMFGFATTVNATPLLALPFTVTTTFPVVAPDGTGTVMEEDFHCVGLAVVPLNFTVLEPWLEPKPDPEIVTEVPTGPEVGDRLLMLGAAFAVELKANSARTRDEKAAVRLGSRHRISHSRMRYSLHLLEYEVGEFTQRAYLRFQGRGAKAHSSREKTARNYEEILSLGWGRGPTFPLD